MQVRFILHLHTRGIISLKAMVVMSSTGMETIIMVKMATTTMTITAMEIGRETMDNPIPMAMVMVSIITKARRTLVI